MKPGIPWSVKGIGPDMREAAKHAARRSGMTVGEWLNAVILDQSNATTEPPAPPETPSVKIFSSAPARPASAPADETTLRLEDIAQQLARLAQRDRETASINYDPPAAAQAEQDMLNRILNRIDSNERQTVDAFTAVNERLSILGRQIAQASRQKAFDRPEDVPGYPALETALRNVVDHMETSEKRTRDTLKSLQDRLAEMAQRASTSESPAVVEEAPAFVRLEDRLSELAERIDRSENGARESLPERVGAELSHLAERIETVREHAESLAERAQTSGVEAAQHELRDIETRILTLLNEAQSTLAGSAGNGAALERQRTEIGALNQRIDEVRNASASDRDVQALRVAVEQLSTRVAQGPDLRPMADLDHRLAELTQRLEQAQTRPNTQLGELERRMAELDQRLGDAMVGRDDGEALSALQLQIAAVDERVGRTEQQFSHLETIERAIGQLYESLEQNRKTITDVAEDAASRMADRILNAHPQPAGPSPELAAMEEGLRAVRASAQSADQRNQETLAAVHDTLEQIVGKLSELETAAAGQHLAAAMAQDLPNQQVSWLPPELQPAPLPNSLRTGSETLPASSNPFADLGPTPAMPRTDPPLPPPADLEAAVQGDDFIAAARRAAQAAAGKTAFPANGRTAKPSAAKSAFRFPIPFRKGRTEPVPAMTSASGLTMSAANSNEGKRRRLLLAGIVLLAAVSAFTFNLMGRSAKLLPVPAKEQSLLLPQKQIAPKTVAPMRTGIESGLPAPDDIVKDKEDSPIKSDGLVTGSLASPRSDTSLAAIVAESGSALEVPIAPPVEIGPKGLRDAAARGDATAQFIVASRYLDGKPVEQDYTKAAYWYQQAAARGLPPAQYRIATLFERGRGVPQDVAAAFLWYERAATGGNVKAMHNAAVIAAGNQLGAPKYDRAFKWFSAAAAHGLKDSQFNLAVLHERGLGTKASSVEALFWYTLAGRQEDADALSRASAISRSLSPAMVEDVIRRVEDWKAEPTAGDANVVAVGDDSWNDDNAASVRPSRQSRLTPPVLEAQQLLASLGFSVGKPDGTLNSRTANAIRLFQLQSGMKVTGEVTPSLIDEMHAKLG